MINELWEEFKREAEVDIESLVPKEKLDPSFWNHRAEFRTSAREKLLQIANDFFDSLKVTGTANLKDVILTGSMASFNWSKYSDIDLHLILDFVDVDENEELVKEYFNGKIFIWNNKHNIKINDHEVEIYVQDEKEPHYAAGIYSLMKDEWIKNPEKVNFDIDLATVEKKFNHLADQIERVFDLFETRSYYKTSEAGKRIKEKIKNMRRHGLSKDGIYSVENLAFKMLRRSDHLKLLNDLITKSYDRMMSLHKDLHGSLKIFMNNLEEEEIDESYDPVLEEENYQRRIRNRHYLNKKALIGFGKQKNTSPYKRKPNYKRSKSAPAGFGGS